MKIIFSTKNDKYFITLQGYTKPNNNVAILLKIPIASYNDMLRQYGAYKDIDGNIYFLNKKQAIQICNDLNNLLKTKKGK